MAEFACQWFSLRCFCLELVELVIDGRSLDRPVNYVLVSVVTLAGIELDPKRRPFVIADPRTGHGPGIGGFKADSEIGVAFKAGHPCYFIGFLPDPMLEHTFDLRLTS